MVLALVLFLALFDWNSFRGPIERYASRTMDRAVGIGHLAVKLSLTAPTVVLSDVTLGNPEWIESQPMGQARELRFSVSLLSLLTDEIRVPYMTLTDAEVNFVRDAQGRANWRFGDEKEPRRRTMRVLTLSLDDARVGYRDAINDLAADFHAFTQKEGQYETRIGFAGKWRGSAFQGTADTGNVLSLRGSTQSFPMRIVGKAGATSIRAEGEVADITRFRYIDADLAISGPSLASLYQTLKVALPETPPYQARGRLKRQGDTYSYENFKGTIGSTDVAGNATYELRKPRNTLQAELRSQMLDVADLGPLVGAKKGGAKDVADPTRSARAGRTADGDRAVKAKAKAADGGAGTQGNAGGVLPDTSFNLEKLNSMDADVKLTAAKLRFPGQVPLHNFATRARLESGTLSLDPINFRFAGGEVAGKIALDASKQPLAGSISADFKRVKLSDLFPTLGQLKDSVGSLGAQIRLSGRGNSVAALLGSSNGTVTVGMAGGRVSELAVWLVNLHGGELIPLLFGGDRPTPIRCAAAALDVKNGIGRITTFVFDTEESTITGSGGIDFKNERVDLTLRPEAKKPGVLSIRGPVNIHGPFRDVDFAVAPQSIARGLGAIALGLVNPILALLPLIETGPGEDTNCRSVLEPVKGAVEQSGKSVQEAPANGEKRGRNSNAPIVNVPPEKSANRQPAAPIVEVPGKK
ncbi:MAG: AsmA family protein [Burkholderiaceae bacterium]